MHISTRTLDLRDTELDHSLYVQCLKLRKELFINQLGWNLYESMGCEHDQYDTPAAVHTVALSGSQVIGCMRLMPTDYSQGNTTYMILDAHLGRIQNLPTGLLSEEVKSPATWEASRLAISPKLASKERNNVLLSLMRAAIEFASSQGATSLLGLMNPAFERVFKRNGLNAYRFGPVLEQRDGRICVLKLDFENALSLT